MISAANSPMQTGLGDGQRMMIQHSPATSSHTTQLHGRPIVFVIDDDVSIRESLELLIASEGWEAETFSSAAEFLSHPRAAVPQCLILDITLPDANGLELQKRIASERKDMPIIFITGYGDVPMSVQAMKAGAVEFLLKPFRDDVLVSAIRQALDRSIVVLRREAEMKPLRDQYSLLTPREREVMALVVTGLLNKQVGWELGISEITVKAHRGNIMQKMKAESLADLVRMAGRLGLPGQNKSQQNGVPRALLNGSMRPCHCA